jgi:glucose/arabinose dehydrogenase
MLALVNVLSIHVAVDIRAAHQDKWSRTPHFHVDRPVVDHVFEQLALDEQFDHSFLSQGAWIMIRPSTLVLFAIGVVPVSAARGQGFDPDNPILAPIPKSSIRIELQTVASGLDGPNSAVAARDASGRLFVTEQDGQVRVVQSGTLLPTPFLDVSDKLVSLGVFGTQDPFDFDERGLLSIAFHPDFENSTEGGYQKFYTYTSEPVSAKAATFTVPIPSGASFDHRSVVREWTMQDITSNVFDGGESRTVLTVDEPQFNHNGGQLSFGPDGYLYIQLGDGGSADDQDGQDFFGGSGNTVGHGPEGNGQNIDTALGSILRIDPTGRDVNNAYSVPSDNPLVGKDGLDEIFAFGFRNPFRGGFDVDPATGESFGPYTGQLIVGDVGQNDIEEIDIVTKGGNFGWRIKEGSFFFDPGGPQPGSGDVSETDVTNSPQKLLDSLIDPVAEYDHRVGDGNDLAEGLSAIGGFIYRGDTIPQLDGKYVFGDFAQAFDATNPSGRLFVADLGTGLIEELTIGLDDRPLGMFVNGLGQDEQGNLYITGNTFGFGPFGGHGIVQKIITIPEPTTGLIATLGLFILFRRRLGNSAR